ncbi:hypothetical protein [Actinomyces glycerinitolerans]|uniref:Uncharacterized protein n=1 Tax=Actinomyces glycerinitolerans TaxID=1892869 RepID=A0A1M4RWP8_9ACTO|nr:hypothetical protein [Actinomyces glycerinitolerans]SHE24341.1 Hypothetical protein ACGLYG10_0542 [Actinomyces glycerinitolerans]
MWAVIGGFAFTLMLIGYWVLAMFTDTGPGEFAREISAQMGVKNNLSLTIPATGLAFLCACPLGVPVIADSAFGTVLGFAGFFFVLVGLVSFLPISLPAWMYPEWHVEWRRRRRRERLAGENSWRDTSRLEPGEPSRPEVGRTNNRSSSEATHPSPDSSGDDA